MNIFECQSSSEILRHALHHRKTQGTKLSQAELAEALRVQKTYISRILRGEAVCSGDQAYRAGRYLGFDRLEMEYLSTTVEYERSGLSERKELLRQDLNRLREQALSIRRHLQAEMIDLESEEFLCEYYLNPIYFVLHNALNIERFARDPKSLRVKLKMDKESFEKALKFLEAAQVIGRTQDGYQVLRAHIQLPKESKFLYPHQCLMRAFCNEWLSTLAPRKEDYNFYATVSMDETCRDEIQREFMKFLKVVEKSVRKAPSESVYQINFSLFPWIKS